MFDAYTDNTKKHHAISSFLNMTLREFERSRCFEHKIARFSYIKALREKGYSLNQIAREFRCTHATVINALNSIDALMYLEQVSALHDKIRRYVDEEHGK